MSDALRKDAANLLFALRDAWPYVHQWCHIDSIKQRHAELMRRHGDFADLHAQHAPPIDMVLHCPACGLQHIDEPEGDDDEATARRVVVWTNPPHRSHLCAGCGHIWRPADVPTNGVEAVKTKGERDSPIAARPVAAPLDKEQMHEVLGTAGIDLLELAKEWADNKVHVYQFVSRAEAIVGAVLVRAGLKR